MDLITIVVPVYNKSQYIANTLEQILSQSYNNLEIICIDDCSTDDSYEILKKYKENDSRIILLRNQIRLGAAESRNRGLDIGRGKYIIFLDADDYYANDLVEKAYTSICKYEADVVILPFERITRCRIADYVNKIYADERQKEVFGREEYPKEIVNKFGVVIWNKMYNVDYLKRNNIRYQNLSSSNDVYFGISSICLANKVVLVNDQKSYIKHIIGIKGQISNNRKSQNAYLAWKKVHDTLVENGLWGELNEDILLVVVRNLKEELKKCNDDKMNRSLFNHVQIEFYKDFSLDENYKDVKSDKVKSDLLKIRQSTFEDYMTTLSFSLMLNRYCTGELIDKLKNYQKNGEVVIWGAGQRACEFLDFLENNDINVTYVVDRDKNKHKKFDDINIEVCSWEKIKKEAACVCVLRDTYYDDIYNEIKKLDENIDVINVEGYAPFCVE